MQKNAQEHIITNEADLEKIVFTLNAGDRIFFSGDLGSGKSTFIRHLIRKHTNNPGLIVRSPTYTYYQKYENIYHCDLYRLEDYSSWVSIGGKEIADDSESILLIEWPNIVSSDIVPSKTVQIEIIEDEMRKITITDFSVSPE
ncbi:tRNA (adenosine(37)-N6)-threonylcarbamoyltransferase complex ATPase subunit type 1 TsaE [Candidatus Gracilibacteria bacterium]|nr:tRNA (adenosine(37)-N6)-threonylcarbamoyltransferase complex ATPase subunit type 1 TsaE [Candidatus Gracilibacteria bacterium]